MMEWEENDWLKVGDEGVQQWLVEQTTCKSKLTGKNHLMKMK